MAAQRINKARTGGNAIAFVVLVLGGIIALNLIASRASLRKDFTQDHIYTLSQPSKDLVAKLPDRMTVKAFISSDLQPPFSQAAQYVRDTLDEYKNSSNGKFVWEAVDPGTDPKLEEEATKLKVPKMRRGKISSNKVEIGANYLGVAFQYQGQIESIPEVNGPEGLEFEMTSIIKRLTVKKKKIAFASSEGELQPGQGGPQGQGGGLSIVGQFLKDYDVVPVTLSSGDKPIPDDADALVIAGPKQAFSERAKYVIDQFLMKGKSVAFFVDGMVLETPRNMQMPGMDGGPRIGRKNDVQLDDLLEHYGFKLHDDIVMEPRLNVPGPVAVQGQMFLANYPAFIATTKVDEASPLVEHLKGIIFPFASSVEPVKGKQPGATYTQVAQTSPDAWRQSGFFLFDPQAQLKPSEDHGPFTVVWTAKGKLTSFFAGKPYPNDKGEKVNPPDANSSTAPGVERPLNESVGVPRIVVVGDSEFASDEYVRLARMIPNYNANMLFFMNIIDWLAQDETLAPIRAKGVQARPLTYASESTPTVVKYANIVGVPLAFILFGVVRWRLRTARRRAAKL
jgi:ABC-type uncharacterized transport system involved in gliding motility auxiliary subunit